MNPALQAPPVPFAGGALGAQRTAATSICAIDPVLLLTRRCPAAKGQLCALRTNIKVALLVVTELRGGKHSVLAHRARRRYRQVSSNAGIFAFLDGVAIKVTAIGQDSHLLDAQRLLALLGHLRQLALIVTVVGYFVGRDQFMLAVYHRLHVVGDIAALARFHPGVAISQRYLALATFFQALLQ